MLLVEENHIAVLTSAHADNKMLYTRRRIGPVVMVDEAGQHAMEAAAPSKTEGIIIMPTTVPDRPEARGVKPALETSKRSPLLVLWPEGSQGERVLEEARRFGQIRIRIR